MQKHWRKFLELIGMEKEPSMAISVSNKRRFTAMNNVRENWYAEKRQEVEKKFQKGKYLHDKRKTFHSESGKYQLQITPVIFKVKDRFWAYTIGKVLASDNKTVLHTIKRDSDKFPFFFTEGHDGKDYLLCGEDRQGQTIIELNTGQTTTYVGEKAKRDMEFAWQKFHVSPDKEHIAIEGYAKSNHKDFSEYRSIRFFNFKQPMILPYYEIGDRITFPYDEGIGWENEQNFLVAVNEERRKSDMKPLKDMTRGRRLKCLEENSYGIRKTVYRMPLHEGERQEVYSEWVVQ